MQKNIYEFISAQNNDPIVERRNCKRTGEPFAIFQSDIDMLDRISPTIWGEKFPLALPTLSPESRFRRMMMFRNERKLYKRTCSATGKSIVALYPEEYEGPVYSSDVRRSDQRDPSTFGKDYVPWKFYETLQQHFKDTPYLNTFAFHNENSDYTNWSEGNRNCYLIFASDHNENCCYGYSIFECKNVLDAYGCKGCENSYGIIDCIQSMKIFYSQKIENWFNIYFSDNMKNCSNTFLCSWLKDKEYFYKNESVGKERREAEIMPLIKTIFAEWRIEEYQIKQKEMGANTISRNMNIINTQSWIWDLVHDSKNVLNCFEVHNAEDVRGVINANGCKDVMWGYVVVDWSQKIYEWIGVAANYSAVTVWNSWTNNKNIYFSNFIINSQNILWSISCKNKEYLILNKQYKKEEREANAREIVKELQSKWKRWEFFDPEFSPFPYNDTVAMEYFPVTPQQLTILQPEKFISDAILDLGWEVKIKTKWRTREKEINIPEWAQKINAKDLPHNINEIWDDIINKTIICETSGRPFRITKVELEFYKMHNLPIPRKHPDIRHEERVKMRPGRNFYTRTCDKCGKEMISVYPQNAEHKVFCDACYTQEIYG